MNIKFNVNLIACGEDLVFPVRGGQLIPVSMQVSIFARANYMMEKPVYRDHNGEGNPGSESVELLHIIDLVADVEWYTPAPDGTMTVYHSLSFTLWEEDAAKWLDAWKVDVQGALEAEEMSYEDIMD